MAKSAYEIICAAAQSEANCRKVDLKAVVNDAATSWKIRGASDLHHLVGDDLMDGLLGLYVTAFERGAQAALRFGKTVVSDPAACGREVEALSLAAEGCDHAGVLAGLRSVQSKKTEKENAVISFRQNSKAGK